MWDLDAIRRSTNYNVIDQSNNQQTNAFSDPADHFSTLRTFMGAASYVTGSHNFRFGATLTNGDWRLIRSMDRRRAADQLQRRRAGVR